jgi:hypothetical protein
LKHQFVAQVDETERHFTEFSEHVVVVAGEVINFGAVHGHFEQATHDFHVFRRKVFFPEIPHVNNVSIQHQGAGLNAFEIIVQFSGMAPVGAQVNIGYDNYIEFAFHLLLVMGCLYTIERKNQHSHKVAKVTPVSTASTFEKRPFGGIPGVPFVFLKNTRAEENVSPSVTSDSAGVNSLVRPTERRACKGRWRGY